MQIRNAALNLSYPRSSAFIGGHLFFPLISHPLKKPGHRTSKYIFRHFSAFLSHLSPSAPSSLKTAC
jgi:hypothetical protein